MLLGFLSLLRTFRAKPQSLRHSRAKVHTLGTRQHVGSFSPRNRRFVFAERICHLFQRQAQLANVYELSDARASNWPLLAVLGRRPVDAQALEVKVPQLGWRDRVRRSTTPIHGTDEPLPIARQGEPPLTLDLLGVRSNR